MAEILRAYFDILMSRRGPDCLPASTTLLALTIAANAGLAIATIISSSEDVSDFVHYVISVVMLMSVLWLVLTWTRHTERYVQSATALFGADIYISTAQVVVFVIAGDPSRLKDPSTTFASMALLLLLGWFLWLVTFVVRRASGLGILPSVAITLIYFVLNLGAVFLLMAPPAQP